jgi:hypothetical protein
MAAAGGSLLDRGSRLETAACYWRRAAPHARSLVPVQVGGVHIDACLPAWGQRTMPRLWVQVENSGPTGPRVQELGMGCGEEVRSRSDRPLAQASYPSR